MRIVFSPGRASLYPSPRPERGFSFYRTRDDGLFSLPSEPNAKAIFVTHQLGYGMASLKGWTNGSRIMMRTGSRMVGRMTINGAPAANEKVELHSLESTLGRMDVTLINFETTTDASGFFAFDQVPAVPVSTSRDLKNGLKNGSGDWVPVNIQKGISSNGAGEVKIDFRGREISGSLQFEAPKPDWKPAPFTAFLVSGPEMEGMTKEIYALAMNPNLTFKGGVLPPGDYRITAVVDDHSESEAEYILRGSVSIATPLSVASPSAGVNLPVAMPVRNRLSGSSTSTPITES